MRSLILKQHLLHLSKAVEMQSLDEMANSNVTSSKPAWRHSAAWDHHGTGSGAARLAGELPRKGFLEPQP